MGCVRTYFLTRLTPGWRKYAPQTASNYDASAVADDDDDDDDDDHHHHNHDACDDGDDDD